MARLDRQRLHSTILSPNQQNKMINVVIDTREQRPWSFPVHAVKAEIGTLRTGDYALKGDDKFAIERKSLDDFLGTISSGWERFLREIGRMDRFDAKVIIVEGNFEQCCFRDSDGTLSTPDHRHNMLAPAFIAKRIAELSLMGVSILFCGTKDYSAAVAYSILRARYYEMLNDGLNKSCR